MDHAFQGSEETDTRLGIRGVLPVNLIRACFFKYNSLLKMSDTETVLRLLENHHKIYKCLPDNPGGFTQYISSLDISTRIPGIIEDLGNCTCCDRHQRYRPLFVIHPSNLPETPRSEKAPFIAPWPSPYETCDCRCRHFSRFLCRSYHDDS